MQLAGAGFVPHARVPEVELVLELALVLTPLLVAELVMTTVLDVVIVLDVVKVVEVVVMPPSGRVDVPVLTVVPVMTVVPVTTDVVAVTDALALAALADEDVELPDAHVVDDCVPQPRPATATPSEVAPQHNALLIGAPLLETFSDLGMQWVPIALVRMRGK